MRCLRVRVIPWVVLVVLAMRGVVDAQPAPVAGPGTTLSGRVVDRTTGAPVAGAIVATGSVETTTVGLKSVVMPSSSGRWLGLSDIRVLTNSLLFKFNLSATLFQVSALHGRRVRSSAWAMAFVLKLTTCNI